MIVVDGNYLIDERRRVSSPYHHGRQRKGIGNGPDRFVETDIVTRLTDCDHEVVERVERDGSFTYEIKASMDLNTALAGVHSLHNRQRLNKCGR